MPLLRITCPPDLTEFIVHQLHTEARASELSVVSGASRLTGGDLILAEVPRSSVDDLLRRLPNAAVVDDLHVAIAPSERLLPVAVADTDDDAVVWAQVIQDVHDTGRLSWINILLMVNAAAIAAVGIIQDNLLLIVGAMALSPDYYPVADACLSFVRGAWRQGLRAIGTLALSFGAAVLGSFVLTVGLKATGIVTADHATSQQLTLFISRPDALTVVVALLAGVAGALAITLPDARGLVGVFVSITTIPAAANMGVAIVAREWNEFAGASIQLFANVCSLLVAGTITLAIRRRLTAASMHGREVHR